MVRHSVTSNKRPLALSGLTGQLEGKVFLEAVSAMAGQEGCFTCWLTVGTQMLPRKLVRAYTHTQGGE